MYADYWVKSSIEFGLGIIVSSMNILETQLVITLFSSNSNDCGSAYFVCLGLNMVTALDVENSLLFNYSIRNCI